MKKIFFLLLLLFFLTSSIKASAQTSLSIVATPQVEVERNKLLPLKQSTGSSVNKLPGLEHQIKIILGRLTAANNRLNKIAQKLALRLQKMEQGASVAKLKQQFTKLRKQQETVFSQLTQVSADLNETTESAKIIIKSDNPQNEYQDFRKRIVSLHTKMKDILQTEISLVKTLKQYQEATNTANLPSK